MRQCRKCEAEIPWSAVVDGKKRSLQKRKFCLTCSPFGAHNTKSADPSRPAKHPGSYRSWSREARKEQEQRAKERGHKLKAALVAQAGDGCMWCGYRRCMAALVFHHVDPSTKSFGLEAHTLRSKSAEKINQEYQKCILLCVRCHAEHHAGLGPLAQG